MSDADRPSDSVLGALGIDVDSMDIPVADDAWQAMLAVAFDPATPAADSSIVPVMDDSGDVVDVGSDDVEPAIHHGNEPGDHTHDGQHGGDEILLDPDAGFDHHDAGTDHAAPDHGDQHGHDDSGWHV